jgi:deazaflavin-dependent oxidoreductase (nitroreductase family)
MSSHHQQEAAVPDARGRNTEITAEFRANGGRVGGGFTGIPMLLLHHRGRKTGREYVIPLVYLPDERSPGVYYLFASNGGLPIQPDWYYNLTISGTAIIEDGTSTFDVTVHDLVGPDRDRIFAEQARRYPGYADYEKQTSGIRTIPVLQLTRI